MSCASCPSGSTSARSTSTTPSIRRCRSIEQGTELITRARHLALAGLLLLASLCAPARSSAREYLQLFVTEPYLEMHTGPGRGYPVFHVVPRDGSVDVLFRRTDWFKVRTEHGVEGWVSQDDMQKTVLANGARFHYDLGDRAGF